MVRIPAEETIKVKWIVGVYYAAFVGVVIYVLYDIITSHRWAEFTAPSTYKSPWFLGDRSWKGPHSNYWCLNSTFDWPLTTSQFQYEGPHNLTNVSCAWLDNTEISNFIHDGSIGLPTMYEVATAGELIPTPYFVTDVDALSLYFNHGFQHDATGSTPLPETIVYDVSGKEYTRFASKSLLALSFTDLLKILNVNLDAKSPTLPQLGVADSTFRHTGVYVLMSFSYTNYDSGTAAERVVCRVTFNVVADVWGVLETKDHTTYYGIKLKISQDGSIGSFSTYVFGVYILNTIVFLGVAEFLARSAFMLQKRLRQQCPCMQTIVEDSSDEDNDGVTMKPTVTNMVDDGNSAPHSLNGSQQATSARHHHHHGAETPVKYLTPEIDDVDNASGFPVRQ